jgi:hypothetical protein
MGEFVCLGETSPPLLSIWAYGLRLLTGSSEHDRISGHVGVMSNGASIRGSSGIYGNTSLLAKYSLVKNRYEYYVSAGGMILMPE